MNKNGCSTTKENGTFAYETFWSNIKLCNLVQWDYRDNNGELHSGIAKTVQQAIDQASKFGYQH